MNHQSNMHPEAVFPTVLIPSHVVKQTEQLLAQRRFWQSSERVVYWAGREFEDTWIVTTLIRPQARLTRGSFRTTEASNARVISFLAENNLTLLGQLHTHPGNWVDHSDGDDEDAFMPFENYLSLVVPVYGRAGMIPFEICGVHRFESGHFRRLSDHEVKTTLQVIPTLRDLEQ